MANTHRRPQGKLQPPIRYQTYISIQFPPEVPKPSILLRLWRMMLQIHLKWRKSLLNPISSHQPILYNQFTTHQESPNQIYPFIINTNLQPPRIRTSYPPPHKMLLVLPLALPSYSRRPTRRLFTTILQRLWSTPLYASATRPRLLLLWKVRACHGKYRTFFCSQFGRVCVVKFLSR